MAVTVKQYWMQDRLRQLPQVQTLLETDAAIRLIRDYGHADVTNAVRLRLDDARSAILKGLPNSASQVIDESFFTEIAHSLKASRETTLKPIINATGVLISTNLGRAQLAPEAVDAIQVIASTYSTLEIDLETGKRGSRQDHVEAMICQLTGAEAALVVNNCAAAVLACLSALAAKKEVIASRGELVEIGGSFRMPDVIAQSGALLKEVGATNKTRLSDYETAIGDETALLLKSHTSNFKIVGFTSAPTRAEMADLAQRSAIPLIEDLGSGLLVKLAHCNLPDEPIVRDVLKAGVDLVTFSGDKLLGGPQAGIIAGKRELVERISKHPMTRTFRIDKLSLAALQATLSLYVSPNDPFARIPILMALCEPIESIQQRAEVLKRKITAHNGIRAEVVSTTALAGGGTLPEQDLPSFAVALTPSNEPAHHLSHRLRNGETPILGRLFEDRLLLDVRAILNTDIGLIADAIKAAASP